MRESKTKFCSVEMERKRLERYLGNTVSMATVTDRRQGYFPGFWLRGWVGPVIKRGARQ